MKVVRDLISELAPLFWDGLAEKAQDSLGKLVLGGVEAVVGDLGVHDAPEALNGVQVWAVGGQLDQIDAAIRACEPFFDGIAPMMGRVVPNDVKS